MLGGPRSNYRPGFFVWATLPVFGYCAWVYYNRHQSRLAIAGDQAAVDRDWVDRQNRLGGDVRRSGGGV
ncbi:hypothetical protein BDF19DRAFT_463226 [Syncephalis fuscata]|nr:hypothetical protein BDF19DRAFT_463226 [Syncephalis fuscata]